MSKLSVYETFLISMKLDQFMKWQGMVSTGGEAKHIITSGLVSVNGSKETRRGRKLRSGDQINFGNIQLIFGESDPLGRRLALDDQ